MTESSPSPASQTADGAFEADAHITLFGYDSTAARVELLPRSRAWRLRGVIPIGLVTLVVAPVVGAIPPHAPWVLAVVGTGTFLGRRRWKWHYTLLGLKGSCPRCGAELSAESGRLREPHTLTCGACHNDVVLKVPAEVLEAHRSETE